MVAVAAAVGVDVKADVDMGVRWGWVAGAVGDWGEARWELRFGEPGGGWRAGGGRCEAKGWSDEG